MKRWIGGGTDNTKYTDEYVKANRASIVALQMNGDKPDFYIISREVFAQKYKSVPVAEVANRNAKLWKALIRSPRGQGLAFRQETAFDRRFEG